jgi:hypothetical protein
MLGGLIMPVLARNLLMLPIITIVRIPVIFFVIGLEKVVKMGYIFQDFLDDKGVYWKR